MYAGTVARRRRNHHKGKRSQQVPANMSSIMTMIEESEKLKSGLEGKAEHLADTSRTLHVC